MMISEFVLARIEETEANVYAWDGDAECRVATAWTGERPGHTTLASARPGQPWIANGREVEKLASVTILFDPARVLRECKAHRAIVEMAVAYIQERRRLMNGQPSWGDEHPSTLLALASVWSDHPDFDQRWVSP